MAIRIKTWKDIALYALCITAATLFLVVFFNWLLMPMEHFRAVWWVGVAITLLMTPLGATAVALYLRRLHLLEDELKKRLAHDELTGLFNRRDLADREAQLTALAGILFMIDIDNFKQINDEYGHEAGDEILCGVADCLSNNCRTGDIVMRFGGDEFMIISPGLSEAGAERMAERLLAKVRTSASAQQMRRLVTISGGWAYKPAGMPVSEILKHADRGLYMAKASGRDRIVAGPAVRQMAQPPSPRRMTA